MKKHTPPTTLALLATAMLAVTLHAEPPMAPPAKLPTTPAEVAALIKTTEEARQWHEQLKKRREQAANDWATAGDRQTVDNLWVDTLRCGGSSIEALSPIGSPSFSSPFGLSLGSAPGRNPVLHIMADYWTFSDLPDYGGHNAGAPNIDRLGSQGLVFNRAYAIAAMCQPCRSEFYTGQFPMRNGLNPQC